MAAVQLRRGFKADAERIAVRYRNEMSLTATAPLPAQALAAHLNIPLLSPEEIPGMPSEILRELLEVSSDRWSAVTITPGGRTIILFNPSHSGGRHESNVMHEMGHIICEHEPGPFKVFPGFPIPLRPHDPMCEAEAECLGACLQLPREALLHAIMTGMKDDEIAEYFGASLQMVRYRRQITGIDAQLRRRTAYA